MCGSLRNRSGRPGVGFVPLGDVDEHRATLLGVVKQAISALRVTHRLRRQDGGWSRVLW